MGWFGAAPCVTRMSSDHLACLSTGSTERPISLTPRLSNSGFSLASAPSSVVQTGVKSLGCENSSAQLLPIQSWNLIFPSKLLRPLVAQAHDILRERFEAGGSAEDYLP